MGVRGGSGIGRLDDIVLVDQEIEGHAGLRVDIDMR